MVATDINAIIANLLSFYDFKEKTVLHVGAGGGQLMAYARSAKHVIAVDSDAEALAILERTLIDLELASRVTIVHQDWYSVFTPADLVFFEFSLHEMIDPAAALRHASQLAPEILVLDHHPNSLWARCVDETEKATRSWAEAHRKTVVREITYRTEQSFDDFGSLEFKVASQGPAAKARIQDFSTCPQILISMDYTLSLISSHSS